MTDVNSKMVAFYPAASGIMRPDAEKTEENDLWETALILTGAVIIDWTLGDPPNRFHPVAWMGAFIQALKKGGLNRGKIHTFVYGIILIIAGIGLILLISVLLLRYLHGLHILLYFIAGILLFKSSFTFSGLKKTAEGVAERLEKGDMAGARRLVSVHLVSRNTADLDVSEVTSATVESVTENLTDSLVAPLLYFSLSGVPGALVFRFINTADAMLGYRKPDLEYLGKGAARLDDAAGFVPARLAGLLMVAAAWLRRENARGAWKVMLQQHSRTASPNSGWTMSAAAGALDMGLEKKGHYKLGTVEGPLCAEHIYRAVGLVKTTYALTIIMTFLLILLIQR